MSPYSRALKYIFGLRSDPIFSSNSLYISGGPPIPSQHRSITSTATRLGWMDSIKGVFTGNKDTPVEQSNLPVEDFTLLRKLLHFELKLDCLFFVFEKGIIKLDCPHQRLSLLDANIIKRCPF